MKTFTYHFYYPDGMQVLVQNVEHQQEIYNSGITLFCADGSRVRIEAGYRLYSMTPEPEPAPIEPIEIDRQIAEFLDECDKQIFRSMGISFGRLG